MKNYWSRKELEALGEPINPVAPSRLDGRVGGGGKSTPPTPDYVGAAEATAKSNAEAMKVQTAANRPDIYTPFGNQTWQNNRTFDQAGYDDAMSKYNNQVSSAPTKRWVEGTTSSGGESDGWGSGGYFETIPGEKGDMGMPDREKFYSPDQWTQTTNLTPATQKALDDQMAIQQGRSNTALGLMPQVNAAITNPIDKSQLQNWSSVPTTSNMQTVGSAPTLGQMTNSLDLSRMGSAPMLNQMGSSPEFARVGSAPTLQSMLNLSGVPGMPGDSNAAFVQQYVDKANSFARPQNELDQSNMDAKLFNMGLTPGSSAWNNAQRSLADQRSRNEFNAINTGMNQSNQMYMNQLAANNQGFNQALNSGNFTNSALQNQNSMNLANTGFNNTAKMNEFQTELAKLGFNNQSLTGENSMNLANLGFNNSASQNEFNSELAKIGLNNNSMMGQNQMNLANAGFNNNAANTTFNQEMAQSNFANQLRQAQWTMAQQEQLQPLNNLNALINGQQVAMPNMPSFMGAGNSGGVNYSGAANSQYQADLAASNAQNAGTAGLMSGLFSLGGQALGGPMGGMLGKAIGLGG